MGIKIFLSFVLFGIYNCFSQSIVYSNCSMDVVINDSVRRNQADVLIFENVNDFYFDKKIFEDHNFKTLIFTGLNLKSLPDWMKTVKTKSIVITSCTLKFNIFEFLANENIIEFYINNYDLSETPYDMGPNSTLKILSFGNCKTGRLQNDLISNFKNLKKLMVVNSDCENLLETNELVSLEIIKINQNIVESGQKLIDTVLKKFPSIKTIIFEIIQNDESIFIDIKNPLVLLSLSLKVQTSLKINNATFIERLDILGSVDTLEVSLKNNAFIKLMSISSVCRD